MSLKRFKRMTLLEKQNEAALESERQLAEEKVKSSKKTKKTKK
jgi:hypothetical protein